MGGKGVLLPVSSLPHGQLSEGRKFVDWLVSKNYKYWEVLPLNQRDEFGSPYNSPSSLTIDPKYGSKK